MITWHLHTDDYGLHSFETWWLIEDGQRISPNCPSEMMNVGDEVNHYTKGRQIDRILRTTTKHKGDYQLQGRAFDGNADHFIAISCHCSEHTVSSPFTTANNGYSRFKGELMKDYRFAPEPEVRQAIDTLTNYAVYQCAQRWVAEDAAIKRAGKVICGPRCDGTYHREPDGGCTLCPVNEKIREAARKSVC